MKMATTIDDKFKKIEFTEPIEVMTFMDSRGRVNIDKYIRSAIGLKTGDQIYLQINAYRRLPKIENK